MTLYLKNICQLIGLSLLLFIQVQGAKILAISNIPAKSHSMWYNKMVKLLLDNSHEVVFMDVEPKRIEHQNMSHVYLKGAHEHFEAFMDSVQSGAIQMESLVEQYSVMGNIDFLTSPEVLGCRKLMFSPDFQQFLKDYKGYNFDLIIFDIGCDAFLGLVSYFEYVPFIIATPYSDPFNTLEMGIAAYENPSYVPTPFTMFQPEMNFKERVLNTFYKLYYYYKLYFYFTPDQQALAEELFGRSVGSITEILSDVSLLMYTHHTALFGAKPLPPKAIPIAAFHIDPPKPLPKEIKKFMDEAKNGVIYFSLGSSIKSTVMSKKNIQMFLDVFKEMPQRVIWKLEIDDKSNIPPNVMISKWLPQNDILAHSNVRCFIAHGGLHGMQEAVYYGVPVLGLPILFDQVPVIDRLEKEGAGVHLRYHKLSKNYLRNQLDKILTNDSYMIIMKEKSRVFRDNPRTPRQEAMWWIEYVLRNPPSQLKYIRSESADLAWYQRTLLDVTLLIAMVVIGVSYVIVYITGKIARLL